MSIAPLEKRTAGLEQALEQTVSFGETLLAVFKGVLERTDALERAVKQNTAFNISVPETLREISTRMGALENVLKEDTNFNRSAEEAFQGFSERINALKQSIPAILRQSAERTDIPELSAPTHSGGATIPIDPATSDAFRDVLHRLSAVEIAITRIAASGEQTPLDSSAFDALKSSLQNVAERMSVIEAMATRLAKQEPRSAFSTDALDPLQDALKRLTARIGILESTPGAPVVSYQSSQNAVAPDQLQSLAQASQLYPKNKTVVFIGAENFADNIKYAYLAFRSFIQGTEITASFLCNSRRQYEQLSAAQLPCISPSPADWSAQDVRTLISAKVTVLDDIVNLRDEQSATAHALLKGAKSIQLWHGLPFKEIGLQNLFSTRESKELRADALAACGPFDVMVAATATSRRDWERAFSFREFAPIGFPRTDIFFQNLSSHDRINVDEKALEIVQAAAGQNKRVVLYAPTFRDHNPMWFETTDFDALATHCAERNWLLFVNLHPREQGAVAELRVQYPNVSFVEPNTDIFPIAKFSDCLVTDYSSLAFDFLYCDRPVVFYRPDHTDYLARACNLVPKHESLIAGPVTSTVDELIATVANVFDRPDMDTFRETRSLLRKKLFDYQDGKSGGRFCALVQRYLEPGLRFVPVST